MAISCSVAQKKALGITPPESGIRKFNYNGWKVTGDLRGSSDKYTAKKGSQRITWRF